MKNIQPKRKGWACGSSTWSRGSSAVVPSDRSLETTGRGPALASDCASRSCSKSRARTCLARRVARRGSCRVLEQLSPHLAVLDVNLNGELVRPLAEILQVRGIPFVFATAYADDGHMFPAAAKGAPRLGTPVLPNGLLAQIERMLR